MQRLLIASFVFVALACSQVVAFEPTSNYTVMDIQGWRVLVNKGLLDPEKKELYEGGQRALEKFHDDLYAINQCVNEKHLIELRKIPIWLEVDTTVNAEGKKYPCFHYHPEKEWLLDNDYNPEKLDCVEIGKASVYARQGDRSLRIMLHELTHGYHDRVLGFHDKSIRESYTRGKASGKYPERIYAMTDFKEYFAEMTVWYFDNFERRDVATKRDPKGMELITKIWGIPPHRLHEEEVKFRGPRIIRQEVHLKPAPKLTYRPTEKYIKRNIRGWTVMVDPVLVGSEKRIGQLAIDEIDLQLRLIQRLMPAFAVKDMQKCTLWLEGENDHHSPCACFHGGRDWLVKVGENPDKAGGIEMSNAARFVRWSKAQPWVLLHELTHYYHFRVLNKNKDLIAKLQKGFERAKASGTYDSVLRYHGRKLHHYAIASVAEYFAESTEAYFGVNDYYPFVRAELMHHDPYAYELMREIWRQGQAEQQEPVDFDRHKNLIVSAIPESERKRLKLDPFYVKYCSARGFPVVSSKAVSDYALKEAAYLINRLLLDRPDVRNELIKSKVRFVVIGCNEYTTDIPEYRTLEPAEYWDRRARGLGPSRKRPAVSCGEENLLCFEGDPYHKENIGIHEFAHAMHLMGLNGIDKSFQKKLDACFKKATDKGLWLGKYAATNAAEYWAEGVQSYLNDNRENDHDHNHVNTRKELFEYDRDLALLVARELRNTKWEYKKPAARPVASAHMKGYNASKSPKFAWPEKLQKVYDEHMKKLKEERAKKVEEFKKKQAEEERKKADSKEKQ